MSATSYRIFVAITPGLEVLLAEELQELIGILPELRRGGVELRGDQQALWQICLGSRLAESVRVRLGRAFRARNFAELHRGLVRLPWAAFLRRGGALPPLKVRCLRSRLFHSEAVRERLEQSLQQLLGVGALSKREDELAVHLRIESDQVTASVEASGQLYRRGYRSRVGAAPLRETLAAACLRGSGYSGEPLWDPFCGSGGIVLEALQQAAGAAPGGLRSFPCELWPTHDPAAFASFRARIVAVGTCQSRAFGSDLDARVLEAAEVNAREAGLAEQVRWVCADFHQAVEQVPEGVMLLTNPPYGRRLGDQAAGLARRFGAFLRRHRRRLGAIWVLTGQREFQRLSGLRWRTALRFSNRGVPVQLLHLQPKR